MVPTTLTQEHIYTLTYKQVEHDVGYNDIKRAEVDKCSCVVATVSLPVTMFIWGTEWGLHLEPEEIIKTACIIMLITIKMQSLW